MLKRNLWCSLLAAAGLLAICAPALSQEPPPNRVSIAVGASLVRGTTSAGRVVTVTLLSDQRERIGSWEAQADRHGTFQVELGEDRYDPHTGKGEIHRAVPGSIVEVAFTAGDPVILLTPELIARSDPDREMIVGTAPPGRPLEITVNTGTSTFTTTTESDLLGNYQVPLEGIVDIEPGIVSTVTLTSASGHRHYTRSSPISLLVQLGQSYLDGRTSLGYPVSARLASDTGRIVSSGYFAPASMLRDSGDFYIPLFDGLGGNGDIKPGDQLTVASGGDLVSHRIPELDGKLHVLDNTVIGRTVPNAEVTIDAVNPVTGESTSNKLLADASGRFVHDLSGIFDLPYNATVSAAISYDKGRHRLLKRLIAPGMTLDLASLEVTGAIAPSTNLQATLSRSGRTVAESRALTDIDGRFVAALQGDRAERLVLAEGDDLVVTAPTVERDSTMSLTVPTLRIEADAVTGEVLGRASAGDRLEARVLRAIGYSATRPSSTSRPEREADGSFRAVFSSPPAIKAGAAIRARVILPSGHRLENRQVLPMINVEHSGDSICGVSMPHDRLQLQVQDPRGKVLAELHTIADRRGFYLVKVPISTQEGSRLVAGNRVIGNFFEGAATMEIPRLVTVADLDREELRIETEPMLSLTIDYPSRSCLDETPDEAYDFLRDPGGSHYEGRADNGGSKVKRLEVERLAHGVDVAVFTEAGHRVYRRAYHPLRARVFLDTDRVELIGNAREEVRVRLRASSTGPVLAAYDARLSDPDGLHYGALRDERGQAVVAGASNVVELDSGRGLDPIVLPLIDFDFSPETGIQGRAPALQAITLEFFTVAGRVQSGGRAVPFKVTSDDRGGFEFLLEHVPPRAGWSMGDLTGINAILETAQGHEIVAAWPRRMVRIPQAIFLPSLSNP